MRSGCRRDFEEFANDNPIAAEVLNPETGERAPRVGEPKEPRVSP